MTSPKKVSTRYDKQAALFKAMAHPVRLGILDVLRDGEACVCHLEAALGLRQAYISQQLSVLKEAGLVTDRREGWYTYFQIREEHLAQIMALAAELTGEKAGRTPPKPELCSCPKCSPDSETGCSGTK